MEENIGFTQFFKKCPEVADKESRVIFLFNEDEYGLPPGKYAFVEGYCIEPRCDCRKVMINVFRFDKLKDEKGEIYGTIGFGWEDLAYYEKWLYGDKKLAREIKEPGIEHGAPQSEYSQACLKLVREKAYKDPIYMERLKEHYKLFKDVVKKEGIIKIDKIGRNNPCSCGSGKKYKKCCG